MSDAVYMSPREVAARWSVHWRTALRIVRRYRRTAVLRLSPSCVRIPRAVVLEIERQRRGCGTYDLDREATS